MIKKICFCEDWRNSRSCQLLTLDPFKDLYFRKATDSGATWSPDPAAKPSGSCSSLVREAAALDSGTARADTDRQRT